MRTPVLALSGVSKSYGGVRALVGVNLEVHAHEVVAVVGDNGAGKSTLADVAAGALRPDAGSIVFDGKPVTLASPAAARAMGIATVFQDLALCENLDVVENLFLGQETIRRGLLDEVAMERQAWELLNGLSARVPSVRAQVGELSGAQRKTIAVARALLGRPRVVILDEPTAGLGMSQSAEVLALVERLRERGHGVVLISHSMADAQAVADRVVVLRLGRVNGEFVASTASYEDLMAAATGARTAPRVTDRSGSTDRGVAS